MHEPALPAHHLSNRLFRQRTCAPRHLPIAAICVILADSALSLPSGPRASPILFPRSRHRRRRRLLSRHWSLPPHAQSAGRLDRSQLHPSPSKPLPTLAFLASWDRVFSSCTGVYQLEFEARCTASSESARIPASLPLPPPPPTNTAATHCRRTRRPWEEPGVAVHAETPSPPGTARPSPPSFAGPQRPVPSLTTHPSSCGAVSTALPVEPSDIPAARLPKTLSVCCLKTATDVSKGEPPLHLNLNRYTGGLLFCSAPIISSRYCSRLSSSPCHLG